MASPVLSAIDTQVPAFLRPTSVLMLRTPIPPSQGTDPYHDAFGPFCLPSFPFSALESGSSTPLPPTNSLTMSANERTGADLLRNALAASSTGRRRGRWIDDDGTLTTHHLSSEPDDVAGTSADTSDEIPKREFCVTSLTILGHRTVNIDQLVDKILEGSEDTGNGRKPFRGAVITSQRAVEAWMEAAVIAAEQIRSGKETKTNWPRTPVFAVGPATAEALRAAAKQTILPLRTSLVMGGGATGTGEALANYIIRHFNGPQGAAPGDSLEVNADEPPLLYLSGDKNAPTIPDMLSSASPPIQVQQLMVYETCLHPQFVHACSTLSRSLPPAPQSRPGSRRSSRAGSSSSTRRPSVGSLFGGGIGAALERKRSGGASDYGQKPTGLNHSNHSMSGSTGPALTAMTPFASTPEQQHTPEFLASPLEDMEIPPLDTDIGLGTGTGTKPDWIVFFSPSGIQYALEDLQKRKWLPGPYTFDAEKQQYAKDSPESARRKEKWLSMGPPEGYPRLAVIGPTTKRWVRQNLGFQPDAVAASPGPTELREAIRMGERRIRRERDRTKAERALQERLKKEEKARLVGIADGEGVPMEMD